MAPAVAQKKEPGDSVIALVGNPNVGKSSLFNDLTGCHQHTGNWPGKTVAIAQGRCVYKGRGYTLVDLPGTYSLLSQSEEEWVAAEFILSGEADCTLVLCDGTNLERTLNLALQVLQLTDRVIVGVNLLDEAEAKGIRVDCGALERALGVPVIGLAVKTGRGLGQLQERLRNVIDGFVPLHPKRVFSEDTDILNLCSNDSDSISRDFVLAAESMAAMAIGGALPPTPQRLDRIVLGRWSGRAVMLLLLMGVFWLTMVGANVPSQGLNWLFGRVEVLLRRWTNALPKQVSGLLLDGIYVTTANVVAVMLPPMAIFFPLFTLLEDFGYLPRAAFLLDHSFENCGACGKQGLTMCMGFGCNAAGVVGCRIISTPRERLIAILTNSFVPCNGRFPAIIALISCFFAGSSLTAALLLTLAVLLGVVMTFLASFFLHGTLLRGVPSQMILELPPYRKPCLGRILIRSLLDRTIFVLGRAAAVAAPAGAVIWLLQNKTELLPWAAAILEPIGVFLGMNGVLLLAFLLSFPANELLLPLTLMLLQGGGLGMSVQTEELVVVLAQNGWTWQTALCAIVFLLFHWPCSTTCLTIRKETGSWKWTLFAIVLPTAIGAVLCAVISHALPFSSL